MNISWTKQRWIIHFFNFILLMKLPTSSSWLRLCWSHVVELVQIHFQSRFLVMTFRCSSSCSRINILLLNVDNVHSFISRQVAPSSPFPRTRCSWRGEDMTTVTGKSLSVTSVGLPVNSFQLTRMGRYIIFVYMYVWKIMSVVMYSSIWLRIGARDGSRLLVLCCYVRKLWVLSRKWQV
jgi:hypothetical protein